MPTTMTAGFKGIHLVGSLPFHDGAEAFDWVGKTMSKWVRRVPDETGDRAGFVITQFLTFSENPSLELIPIEETPPLIPIRRARPKTGVRGQDVHFARFGYPDAARASYQAFVEARETGKLPASTRFLFPMPTPLETVAMYVVPEAQKELLPPYEEQSRIAVQEIVDSIPHEDLAFQWDVPGEVMILAGFLPNPYDTKEEMFESIVRMSELIPDDVDLGYHLCWGDRSREDGETSMSDAMSEITEVIPRGMGTDEAEGEGDASPHVLPTPADATELTELSNAIARGVKRRINFLHIPTAQSWKSEINYRPLADLQLRPETELYVGLVHHHDGIEGARARLQALRAVVGHDIGIAAACGMGRFGDDEKFQRAVDTQLILADECASESGKPGA